MEENNMKTVAVVGTVGVPACYGGFESLVQNLIDYQSDGIQSVSYTHLTLPTIA